MAQPSRLLSLVEVLEQCDTATLAVRTRLFVA